jgi:hypothetical protein
MERRSGLRRGSRTPREEAWHIWRGSDRTQGEQTDPYMALCFRGVRDPFTPAWEALTIKLLEPLMDALSRGSTVSL